MSIGFRIAQWKCHFNRSKIDDPPGFHWSHGRLLTEDRQDDVIADWWVGQEARGVSRVVRTDGPSCGAANADAVSRR